MYGSASEETSPKSSAAGASSAPPKTRTPAVDAPVSRDPASATFHPAWRNAAPSARASAAPLTGLGVQRLLHRLRLRSLDVGLLVLVVLALLVVHGLGIHGPDVVVRAVHEVVHGAHRGEHRVVRVVVPVQPVAAHLDVVVQAVEPRADRRDALVVLGVVHRVRLRNPLDEAELELTALGEAELLELAHAELNQLLVVGLPELVAREAEELEPHARLRRVVD